jgi:hypothetical protein
MSFSLILKTPNEIVDTSKKLKHVWGQTMGCFSCQGDGIHLPIVLIVLP